MKACPKVEIKRIPAHIAYTAAFDINDYNDFFDEKTGVNRLQMLADRVEAENPALQIPSIPNDYNYFSHEKGRPVESPMHVRYFDMVTAQGTDCEAYRFVRVGEILAATAVYIGPYELVGETYDFLYQWIKDNGWEIAGDGRSATIHGPWDRESRSEYELEIQIPVK